jgi:hypothetical protein
MTVSPLLSGMSLRFHCSQAGECFIHQSLDILHQVVELAVQVARQVLDVLPSGLLALPFFKHFAQFEHSGNVMALVLVLWIIDPLVHFTVRFAAPLHADFHVFFDTGHGISPFLLLWWWVCLPVLKKCYSSLRLWK